MGTRHLICVVKNGEYKVAQYGQWDGQPENQGVEILDFLQNEVDKTKFTNQIEALSFISKEELEQMWIEAGKDPNEKLIPMEISSKFKDLYPENSKDTGSGILQLIQDSNRKLKLTDNLIFAKDSLSCRWGYVIDLDKNLFEVYEGANETPLNETERFYSIQEQQNPITVHDKTYYPIKQVISFDLDDLPTEEEFLENFED